MNVEALAFRPNGKGSKAETSGRVRVMPHQHSAFGTEGTTSGTPTVDRTVERGRLSLAPFAKGPGEPARRPLNRKILTESVYEAVKEEIMDLQMAPGARINMDQLAHQLKVSTTP